MKKLIATIVVAVCAAFTASATMVDLANAAADTTLANGDVAYGTLSGNYKVSIADGATVVLSNAVINGVNDSACPWAGLTCLGDAQIALVGANTVTGFYSEYPGIFVPQGSVLTIMDDSNDASIGSLTVRCGNSNGGYAVGKAVVKTPPLVNGAGFTFTIEASDAPDGTGNAASYQLNDSGETTIDETGKARRFFRLRAEKL